MDLYYQENHRPTRSMTYLEAIKTGLVKTGDFSGRASRSEFWFFYLFILIGYIVCFTLIMAVSLKLIP